jgi:hypothetical protein
MIFLLIGEMSHCKGITDNGKIQGSLEFSVEGPQILGCHDNPKSGSSPPLFPDNQNQYRVVFDFLMYNIINQNLARMWLSMLLLFGEKSDEPETPAHLFDCDAPGQLAGSLRPAAYPAYPGYQPYPG